MASNNAHARDSDHSEVQSSNAEMAQVAPLSGAGGPVPVKVVPPKSESGVKHDFKVVLSDVMSAPDNSDLMRRVEQRLARVGLSFPGVEVRFSSLTAEAVLPRGEASTTTLWTTTLAMIKAMVGAFVAERHTHKRHPMLNGVSGVLKPGRMTLLLGPPGAGKTTLLRSLAGQMSDNTAVQFTGDLTYNGLQPGVDFVVGRAAAYVDQVDTHLPEMTVAETLYFASEMLGPGLSEVLHEMLMEREAAQGITPDPDLEAMWVATFQDKSKSILVNMFARLLGLEHVMDTVVGDQQLKGISGGQRRRVTSAELAVGLAQCMFMDEASTGLDSATTFQMIQALRNLCKHMNGTYLISLLQPSPETMDLFDDVMVMAGRRIVFHGPKEEVLPYFESLGFVCPASKTTADFLQEVVTSTDQHKYWDCARGTFSYLSPKRLAAHYMESQRGQELISVLESDPYSHELQSYVLHQQEYALTWAQQFGAVFRREVLLSFKFWAIFFSLFALAQTSFVAFIISTTFPRLPKDDLNYGNLYLSVLFFSLMVAFMGGFNFAPLLVRRLNVFFKQRAQCFHGVWSWVIAGSLLRLPELFIGTAIFSVMVYFSVGFIVKAGQFWIFFLVMFAQGWMGVTLFSLMAAITRSDVLAQGLGAVVCLIFIATSGFPIARSSIGGWLIWVYYLNPMSWALRSVAINELTSSDWDISAAPFGPPDQTLGAFTLTSRGFFTDWKWVWAGIGYELGFSLLLILLQGLALTWLGPVINTSPPATEEPDAEDLQHQGAVAVHVRKAKHVRAPRPHQAVPPCAEDPHAAAHAVTVKKSSLPFEPMSLAFHGVNYFVPKPGQRGEELHLLHDTYGSFRPGVLTALMGASGAGKTTLMDVLAGRKTAGRTTGVQTLNGHPKVMSTFARVMGYVEQLDVHVTQATVHEALMFSARLRLDPDIPSDGVKAFVDEVTELVELDSLAHRVVGDLSTEQRKRLTIAVELVANPSVLFADEPTSGLDSRAALLVMKALRNIVNTGRTVVCTIHQPSTEIMLAFDELLLLKPGGYVIYNGPLGESGANLINYLTSFPGVQPPAPTANPSVYMLEVTEPSAEKAQGIDWAQRWVQSEQSKQALQMAQTLCQPQAGTSPISFDRKHAASVLSQWRLLLERNMTTYWRLPAYNVLRFVVTIVLGVFLGLLFLNRGSKTTTMLGLMDILGALYSTTVFMGIANCLIVLPVVANERPVVYRERASGLYSTLTYTMAQGMAELPYLVVQGIVYTIVVYFMIGFAMDVTKFFWFYLFFQLSLLAFTFFGMAIMHLLPSVPIATNGAAFFLLLFNLFCGFLIYKTDIRPWWIWAYYFNPATYVLYGTITTQLGDVWDESIALGPGFSMPVAQFISDTYSYDYAFRGWLVFILAAFIIGFRAIACVGLWKLNWQTR